MLEVTIPAVDRAAKIVSSKVKSFCEKYNISKSDTHSLENYVQSLAENERISNKVKKFITFIQDITADQLLMYCYLKQNLTKIKGEGG